MYNGSNVVGRDSDADWRRERKAQIKKRLEMIGKAHEKLEEIAKMDCELYGRMAEEAFANLFGVLKLKKLELEEEAAALKRS